eukprot:1136484-Pelagomonas_calceolata.AAC.7
MGILRVSGSTRLQNLAGEEGEEEVGLAREGVISTSSGRLNVSVSLDLLALKMVWKEGKNVVSEASRALTKALWKIAPSVLDPRQKIRFAATYAVRKLLGPDAAAPYTPKFAGPVQHLILHAGKVWTSGRSPLPAALNDMMHQTCGGARVLDGIAKAMQLEEYDMAPSRAVLHDFGESFYPVQEHVGLRVSFAHTY